LDNPRLWPSTNNCGIALAKGSENCREDSDVAERAPLGLHRLALIRKTVLSFLEQGRPLARNWVTDVIAVAGLLIVIWARLSLGRNIGFVPAQRELVHSGAYGYMRHPVYTGGLLTTLAFLLRAYSLQNALLMSLRILWFIPIKSLVEEDFLRADPQYAAYMEKVRARWIPYVI
jgi:protein-S-isoprenylcysteine O-methyltransferase Ste14